MKFFLFLFTFFFINSVGFSCREGVIPSEEREDRDIGASAASAIVDVIEEHAVQQNPFKYMFIQQVGCACHIMPAVNFYLLQKARARGGDILAPENFIFRKVDGIATVFPIAKAFYDGIDRLMREEGAYSEYFTSCNKSAALYASFVDKDGNSFHQSSNPLEVSQKLHLSPFQAIDERYYGGESPRGGIYLPVLFKHIEGDIVSVYTHEAGGYKTVALDEEAPFSWQAILEKKGFSGYDTLIPLGGELYCPMKARIGGKKMLYNMGIFEQWLFSIGIDGQNRDIDHAHPLHGAYSEYKMMLGSVPYLSLINRDNFFEYRIANILAANPLLRKRAEKAIDFCFRPWNYYNEAHIIKPGVEEPVPASLEILSTDLALAYYFGSATQNIHAACVETKAFNAVLEIEDIDGIEDLQHDGIVPDAKAFIKLSMERKFSDATGSFSFMDVWLDIKRHLLGEAPVMPQDYLSFSGHGVVYVFGQREFMEASTFENREVATILGFNIIDSYRSSALKPFYRREGTQADIL